MANVYSLEDIKDFHWRKQRIKELSQRWRIPPEQVIDSLLLESYLQEIINKKIIEMDNTR